MNSHESLVLIHGWGMNRHIWDDVVRHFKRIAGEYYSIDTLELPGHGLHASLYFTPNLMAFDGWVDYLAEQIKPNSHIVGWSLGGLIALAIAKRYPEKVKSLTLVSSTPCFIKKKDWPYATEKVLLEQFLTQLNNNPIQTIRYFWSLQLLGSPIDRRIKRIRQQVMDKQPSLNGLYIGLELLKTIDLRECFPQLPLYWYLGENDRLVPQQMVVSLQNHYTNNGLPITYTIHKKLGHAMFLNDPELFTKRIFQWLKKVS